MAAPRGPPEIGGMAGVPKCPPRNLLPPRPGPERSRCRSHTCLHAHTLRKSIQGEAWLLWGQAMCSLTQGDVLHLVHPVAAFSHWQRPQCGEQMSIYSVHAAAQLSMCWETAASPGLVFASFSP